MNYYYFVGLTFNFIKDAHIIVKVYLIMNKSYRIPPTRNFNTVLPAASLQFTSRGNMKVEALKTCESLKKL